MEMYTCKVEEYRWSFTNNSWRNSADMEEKESTTIQEQETSEEKYKREQEEMKNGTDMASKVTCLFIAKKIL